MLVTTLTLSLNLAVVHPALFQISFSGSYRIPLHPTTPVHPISDHYCAYSTPLAKETFCAEVEVLRQEMQSSELVIEGEFLSHDQMVQKGFSEHFGKQVSTNYTFL